MAQPAPKPHERREHDRVQMDVEVTLTSENNFYAGFTHDISEGGVFVASHDVLPIGSEVVFQLKLGKGVVSCKGEVRWIRENSPYLDGVPPGFGVAFTELDDSVVQAINDFIARRREAIFYDEDPW